MARLLGVITLALVLSLLPSRPALAQSTDESMDVEAHALFEAGRTAFAAGRFADALGHFQRAYDLSHRGALLYNIGQCQDRLRRDADALTSFRGFLEAVPDASQRGEVEARIAILEQALSQAAPPPEPTADESPATTSVADTTSDAPPPTPDAPPPPPPTAAASDPGAGPWVVLGVGAAVAIAGIVLVGVAQADISTVQNAPQGSPYANVRDAYEQAPILSGVGFAAIGLGAAAILGGVVWAAVGSSGGSGTSASLRITPTGVSLQGAF